jgi:LysM repeat protein
MDKITHQQAHNLLQALVDHQLKLKIQTRLDAHLAECGECRLYAENLQELENELRRVMQARWQVHPENLSFKVIRTRSRRLRMQNTVLSSVKAVAAVALLVTLFIVVNLFLRQPVSSPAAGSQTMQASVTTENATPSPLSELQPTPGFIRYTVQRGDTIIKIANSFNVSIFSIIEANNLKSGSAVLTPGLILLIPLPLGESTDWVATTDFGKLILTVNAGGTQVIKVDYRFNGWSCGAITYSETVDASSWLITNGKLSLSTSFPNPVPPHDTLDRIYLIGTYDATNQKFFGTWELVSTTICSGTWEAAPASK